MKRICTLLMALVLVVLGLPLLPTEAQAASESDLNFRSNSTGYTVSSCKMSASGVLEIPAVYNGKPVTAISAYAFQARTGLTSITIPDSVTSIGAYAFSGCTGLTSITIPDSVTSIEAYAFRGCTGLTSITIPDSVTSIGDYAFEDCIRLTSITIPDSVTSIGRSAFAGCTSLTSITIPDGVASIGDDAFFECTNMTSVTIPDSVTSIGKSAFYNCNSLTKVNITDIEAWCKISFSPDGNTFFALPEANPLYHAGNLYLNGELVVNLIIPDSVTNIGDYAFFKCTSMTSVTIPDSVTSIGDYAFYDCNSLTSITIPDSVASIGSSAFSGCASLTSITIPEGVTSIGASAFFGCPSLTSITIPDSVTSIGVGAFKSCGSLTSIEIPGGVQFINEEAFAFCGNLKDVVLPKGLDTIKRSAFYGCFGLKNVFHRGSQEDWDWIVMESGNDHLKNATITHNFTFICEHSYSNWTDVGNDMHSKTCSICQDVQTAPHTWNSGSVTKPASCKETGIKTYMCTACNATKTETIAKLTTHTYDHACDTDCNVCGVTRTTTHNYKTTWSKDKTNHWHECSICKDKKDMVAHTPGAEATETTPQTCTTCGYIIKPTLGHTHKYATAWTTDENGHWYACSGCEEQGSYATHDFENACDKDCSICGYTRETSHNYSKDWKSDKDNHWHECAGCGEKADEAAHEPGAEATETTAQTCTICGHEIAPALGLKDTEPTTTPVVPPEPTTTPVVSTEPVGNSEPSADSTVWIIVAVAVVVLGGGAGVGIIIWKKKH